VLNPSTAATGGTYTTSGGNDIWTWTASGSFSPVLYSVSASQSSFTLTGEPVHFIAKLSVHVSAFTASTFQAILSRFSGLSNGARHTASPTNAARHAATLANAAEHDASVTNLPT
jgi:hypothetical protein